MVAFDWPGGCPDSRKPSPGSLPVCGNSDKDASADKYRSALDGKLCPDSSVLTYAGVLSNSVGDALSMLE